MGGEQSELDRLECAYGVASGKWFSHSNPGGLTPAEAMAWELEEVAYYTLMRAAWLRFAAARELHDLLKVADDPDWGAGVGDEI